ncbi:energy transducer TonB [Pseudomonas sp. MWU12-2323]|uniref:energy transducer TonB n=1 Tax=Pseudomonas sp. MWU12-2323 TaxID=2651296 RepID=UPI00128DF970|nr:energy transducer TonB [Pseudomonas sp. MWU12-2323]MPQ69372.1 TonB family protein [Pseudomonas sp. MWU12-2323]
MEQQKVLDAQTKAKSLLQAKWFPGAIASVALVIAIGGHAFTGWNSVSLAKLWNQVEGLEAFKLTTQRSDSNQDRAIQVLQADLRNLQRVNQQLQTDVADLRKSIAEQKRYTKQTPADVESVNQGTKSSGEAVSSEKHPLPIGVNERFDNLIRSRMKPYWEAPPRRAGEEGGSDDTVVIQFRVDRQGSITEVQVVSTSGQMELDNSAVKAALKMGSIPEIAHLNNQAYAQVQNFRLSITSSSMM